MAKYKSVIQMVVVVVLVACCGITMIVGAVTGDKQSNVQAVATAESLPTIEPTVRPTLVTTDAQKECLQDVYAWSNKMGTIVEDEYTKQIEQAIRTADGALGKQAVTAKLEQIDANPAPDCDADIVAWQESYKMGYQSLLNGFEMWEQGMISEGLGAIEVGVAALKVNAEEVGKILAPYSMTE